MEKRQPYMLNLCSIVWRQRESTRILSSRHLQYAFRVKYLTISDIEKLVLLENEHLIFFHLMFVLVEQIFIV